MLNEFIKLINATEDLAEHATVNMPGSACIAFAGEKESIVVRLKNDYRAKGSGVVKFTVNSVYGDSQTQSISFDESNSGEYTDISLPIETAKLGYWLVEIEITLDGKSLGSGTAVYAIVNKPQGYDEFEPDNFFGTMGVGDGMSARRIGMKHDRICAYWRFIQKVQDGKIVYDWDELDTGIERLLESKICVNLMIQPEIMLFNQFLDGVGYRVGTETQIKSCYDIISNQEIMDDYKAFVREAINRYKDKIISLEIINEPDLNLIKPEPGQTCPWGDLSPEKMGIVTARLMEEAYAIIKEVAPEVPVLGMSVSQRRYFAGTPENKSFTDCIFDASTGKKMLDILSIHPYPEPWTVSEDKSTYTTPEQFGLYGWLKSGIEYMKDHGIQQAHMTEIGYAVNYYTSLLSPSRKMHALLIPRALTMVKSFPEITRGLYFCMHGYGLEEYAGSISVEDMSLVTGEAGLGRSYPQTAAITFAQCSYMLHNTEPVKALAIGDAMSAFQFKSPEKTIVAAWADEPSKTISVKGVPSLKVYDVYGNLVGEGDYTAELTESLLYYVADLNDAEKLANAF